MIGDMNITSNSYANRTTTIPNQVVYFSEDGDEIMLEGDESRNTTPTKLSVDDYSGEQTMAQISPEQPTIGMKLMIREFEKRGEGMKAYLVYKVETDVEGVAGYTKRTNNVWRRFSDFLGLHEKIVAKYLPKGIIVPIPPEKSIVALTKTKSISDIENSREIGINRCHQLERFMRRMVQHPRMRTDCDIRDFLTMEGDLPSSLTALSTAGVKKIFKSVGDVFTKMTFHMDEGDRWFDQAQSQIDELDVSLRCLHQITESLVSHRKDIASNTAYMSKALSLLAASEESTTLSRALSALTDTSENVSVTWQNQAEADAAKFSDSIWEYIQLIVSLKEVFDERVRAWQQWKQSQQTLGKKRDQKSKMDLNGKTENAEKMKIEIEETIQRTDQLEHHFIALSKNIKEEMVRFEEDKKDDMRRIMIEYLESLLDTHIQLLKHWQNFEQHAQNIHI